MKSRLQSFMWMIRIVGVFILTFGIYSPVMAVDFPDLTITKNHSGDFGQGDINKTYTIQVTNGGLVPTDGSLITLTDTIPTGLIPQSINSSDPAWTCPTGDISALTVLTCTRTAALAAGANSVITLTVDVAYNAGTGGIISEPPLSLRTVTNTVNVVGGGDQDASNIATDITRIIMRPDLRIIGYELRNEANNAVITSPQPNQSFWVRMTIQNRGGDDSGSFYPGVFLDGKPNYGPDHDDPLASPVPLTWGENTSFSGYHISLPGVNNKGCLYYDPTNAISSASQVVNPERGNYTRKDLLPSIPAGSQDTADVFIGYPTSNTDYLNSRWDNVRNGLDAGSYSLYLYADPQCNADNESYEDNNSYGPISLTVGDAPVGGPADGTSVMTSSGPLAGTVRLHMDSQITAYNTDTVGDLNVSVPMLFKNQFGGDYDSALYVDNTAGTAANITINFFDVLGSFTCAVTDSIPAHSSKSYWLPNVSCLPSPWSGGVNITSSQPITAVGRSHIGAEITSYNDFASGSNTMYVPMLFKNQFGGLYNSALYVQNMSPSNPANITVKFYDVYGNFSGLFNDTLQPLSATGYWIPNRENLPYVWSGGAVVTSDQPIVAIGRPHIGTQVTAYNGFAAGATTVNVPMLYKTKPGAGGTYSSAVYVQNVDAANPATVTLDFYDDDGTFRGSLAGAVLPPLSSTGFWLPLRDFLPDGWSGSAIVTSDRPIVALGRLHVTESVVHEEIMTYNGSSGSSTFYAPVLYKDDFNGSTYNSALVLQNTQNTPANVSISFYSSSGALACINSQTIAAHATANFWLAGFTCP
ncbi:MAG: hypothetical protein U0V02_01290 [Anaerolineales bacterium]